MPVEKFKLRAAQIAMTLSSRFGHHLSILIYHRVGQTKDPLRPDCMDAETFDWQMELLAKYCQPLSLSEAIKLLPQGKLPARAVCVTFDDGYADNESVALPILLRWKIPAVFFVSTGYMNEGCMWNDLILESVRRYSGTELDLSDRGLGIYPTASLEDKIAANACLNRDLLYLEQATRQQHCDYLASLVENIPTDLMMTEEQVRHLHAAGMEVGSHTVTHPILSTLDEKSVWYELSASKEQLEAVIKAPVTLFSYPNGKPQLDYRDDDIRLVRKAGFEAAVATHWGVANRHTDRMQLPRFTPWDRRSDRFLLRMAQNCLRVA